MSTLSSVQNAVNNAKRGGGQTVRIAEGVVRINVAPLTSDVREIKMQFKGISDAGRQIGTGVQQGARQAESAIQSMNKTMQAAARQFAGLFALPTAIGFTQQVKQANFLIRELSGSEELANKRLEQMRQLADRTNQSFVDIQQSAVGLLPAIGRNNVDLEQTLLLAQRLAILDPAQGIEGASYAIRELLGGQITSLAARFEMPRAQLNELMKNAGGDPQQIINGLDQMVAQMGITEDSIVRMGEEGINVFQVLRGEVIETTAMAFEPFLNNAVVPLIRGIGDLLRETRQLNPELLEIAGTLAGILATVTALSAAGMGGKYTKGAGVLAAAGFVGIEAGTAAGRYLAEQGGSLPGGGGVNTRLQNVSQEEAKGVIGETFKQTLVIIASGLAEFAGVIDKGIVISGNVFDRFKVTLELIVKGFELAYEIVKNGFENMLVVLGNVGDKFGAIIELIYLNIQDAMASAVEALGNMIAGIPGLKSQGIEIAMSATQGGGDREIRKSELRNVLNSDITDGAISLADAIAPVSEEIGDLIDLMNTMSLGLTEEQQVEVAARTQKLKEDFVLPLANMLGLISNEAQKVSDRVKSAFGGASEGAPIAEVSDFTDEMLDAFKKFSEEIAELENKAAADRKKAIMDANEAIEKAENKLHDGIQKTTDETNKKRAKAIQEANQADIEAEQEHRDRLKEIRESSDREAQQAAANIDAVGLRAALERGKQAEDSENESYQKQKDQRQQQLQTELAEIQVSSQERIQALRDSYKQETQEIVAQRQQRLAEIDLELREELNQRNTAFAEMHNKMVQESGNHNLQMLAIQQQGTQALEAQYRDWLARMGQQIGFVQVPNAANALASGLAALGSGTTGGSGTPNPFAGLPSSGPILQKKKSTQGGSFSTFKGFATGTGLVEEEGLYRLHAFEGVMNPFTASMMRSMTGSNNPSQAAMQSVIAGRGRSAPNIGSIIFNGDIGNNSRAELASTVRGVVEDVFEEVAEAWSQQ